MRDITTIRDFIARFPKKDIGFIFDRGFSSYGLLEELREDGIHYIVPLKKDSTLIDLRWMRWKEPFLYRDRPLRWGIKRTDYGTLYVFEDPVLRGEEEQALLRKVEANKMTIDMFEEKRKLAGVICLVSDMNKSAIDMFDLYKGREDVELAFDAMKNELESDKTYLRSDEAVRGYFMVTFPAMRIYFKILKRLREMRLTNKISVEEVLFELSKVTKIVEKSGREYFAKIPKKARRMCSLFPEVLPMG
jgi:transposase